MTWYDLPFYRQIPAFVLLSCVSFLISFFFLLPCSRSYLFLDEFRVSLLVIGLSYRRLPVFLFGFFVRFQLLQCNVLLAC